MILICLFIKHLFASADKKSSENGKIGWVQAKFHPSFSMRPPLVQMPVTTVAADFCGNWRWDHSLHHTTVCLGDQTPMRTQRNYATQHHTRRLDTKMNIVTFFAFPQRFSQHLCTAIISFFKINPARIVLANPCAPSTHSIYLVSMQTATNYLWLHAIDAANEDIVR